LEKNRCDGDFFYNCGFRGLLRNPNRDEYYKGEGLMAKIEKQIYSYREE